MFRRAAAALAARHASSNGKENLADELSSATASTAELEALCSDLQTRLAVDSRTGSLWHALGNVQHQLGDISEALVAWAQALRRTDNDAGRILLISKSIDAAGADCAAITESIWPKTRMHLGAISSPAGVAVLSRTSWTALVCGDVAAALPELRSAYRASNGGHRQADNLVAALEAIGSHTEAGCLRARSWLQRGEHERALRVFASEAVNGQLKQPFIGDYLHALRRGGRHADLQAFALTAGDVLLASDCEEWSLSLLDTGQLDAARQVLADAGERLSDTRLQIKQKLLLPAVCASAPDVDVALQALTVGLAAWDQELVYSTQGEHGLTANMPETLFHLGYHADDVSPLLKNYGRIASRLVHATASMAQVTGASPSADTAGRRIRIGYASNHLYFHTVARYFAGWLQHADRQQFEIHLFPMDSEPDWMTDYLRRQVDAMHPRAMDAVEVGKQIRHAELDVLVYLDVGMESLSIQLAAQRLAAVQCVAWGHPLTTGLPNVDYFISAEGMDSVNDADQYSERMLLLPGIGACIPAAKSSGAPPSRTQFGLAASDVVLLSPQSLFKYRPADDWVFPAIVERIPNAILLFFEGEYPAWTGTFTTRLRRAFAAKNADFEAHVRVLPRQSFDTYLGINLLSDMCLDSWGWSGGMTSFDALACGLPLVTLAGKTMRGRQSAAMLKQLDATEAIARDPAEYLQIAARLGNDLAWRIELRGRIRANRQKLFGDRSGVMALEAFFRWVTGSPQAGDEQLFRLGPPPV